MQLGKTPAWLWLAALAFPALADLSETTILQTNMALNLETGSVAASGGDPRMAGRTTC